MRSRLLRRRLGADFMEAFAHRSPWLASRRVCCPCSLILQGSAYNPQGRVANGALCLVDWIPLDEKPVELEDGVAVLLGLRLRDSQELVHHG